MMAPLSESLLAAALEYLTDLSVDDANPPVAQRRLRHLRERYPGARMRLLWQREEYDGSLHYDLLIDPSEPGTVSLSYCPDRALPWPLRGGQRASERVLLRVNGVAMELDQAIACLDFLWDMAPLTDRLVSACLLRQKLEEEPVELSDEELQQATDAFRRAHGLLTVAATEAWMAAHCLSHRDLEELVAGEAAVAILRQRETEGRVLAYYEENRAQFDSARIARLIFYCNEDANRTIKEINAGGDFYALAERAFAEDLVLSSNFFSEVRRNELTPEIGAFVFGQSPGRTAGPFAVDDGYVVIRILAVECAVLDEATADLLKRRLFADWVEERRRSARVEWFWGNKARTADNDTHSDARSRWLL